MTIKSSGSLSILELAAEWGFNSGQGNFRNLSDYYAGDGLVYSGAADGAGNAIPSSGNAISISDFYDTEAFVT